MSLDVNDAQPVEGKIPGPEAKNRLGEIPTPESQETDKENNASRGTPAIRRCGSCSAGTCLRVNRTNGPEISSHSPPRRQ